MTCGSRAWVAHASRVLASASSRSRTFVLLSPCLAHAKPSEKIVAARRVRYPNQFAAR